MTCGADESEILVANIILKYNAEYAHDFLQDKKANKLGFQDAYATILFSMLLLNKEVENDAKRKRKSFFFFFFFSRIFLYEREIRLWNAMVIMLQAKK